MEQAKSWWQSKTIWVNLFMALSPFISALLGFELDKWIQSHPDYVGFIFMGVNMVLRLVTKSEIKVIS